LPEEKLLELIPAAQKYPFAISGYWADVMREGDPLWRQCVPDTRELTASPAGESIDPLAEDRFSPLPGLIHRYPDRVLVLAAMQCAGYCRFCTRRRLVGRAGMQAASPGDVFVYLGAHTEVRDVLLSGGDPMTLPIAELRHWLETLKRLPQLALIRIGTRLPSFAPAAISEELCASLAPFAPLYVNTHFNHPAEITTEAQAACARMRRAGLILANQSVLLCGVNDDAAILRRLGYALLGMGVRPYYLHTMDRITGTAHFRVPLARAAEIWDALAATTSGMAIPRLMLDLPGGGGKMQYMASRLLSRQNAEKEIRYIFRNIENGESVYIESPEMEA
jgi:lysine 2,3-aminomutase